MIGLPDNVSIYLYTEPIDFRERFDASIGVEVVAWKYFYHLPFYRQQDLFAGSGWTPSRSTLVNLEAAVEFALRPLAEYLRTYLKTDSCVGCDDTGVVLITPEKMPNLSGHPRAERIREVLDKAIAWRKTSVGKPPTANEPAEPAAEGWKSNNGSPIAMVRVYGDFAVTTQ